MAGFERDLLQHARGGDAAVGRDHDPGKSAASAFIEGGPLAGGYANAGLNFGAGGDPEFDAKSLLNFGDLSAFDELGGAEGGGDADAQASEQAERGFRGPASALPHKDLLERSFGMSFDGVEAHLGDEAQAANAALGANAYASGSRIAFSSANPDPSLVAHELTHVIQQTGGSVNTAGAGVEKTGEAEAEGVESAVAGGKKAKSALSTDPRLKAIPSMTRGRPALSPAPMFGTGMQFTPSGFEQSGTVNLWRNARGLRMPIAAVPGLFFTVSPSVTLGVGGGVDWTRAAVTARATIDGSVAAGLSYGDPMLAEIYANMQAGATGGFTYERSRAQGSNTGNQGQNRSTTRGRDTWSLSGQIVLQTSFNVGVKLGNGIIEKSFQFGQCEIGRVTGVAWRDGVFQRNQIGWTWGPQPQRFFAEMRSLIARARQIMNMPREAAERAWRGISDGAGWAYNGARRVGSWLNPFD